MSEVAEMEQNHERSMTLATRESMLDIDEILIEQLEEKLPADSNESAREQDL